MKKYFPPRAVIWNYVMHFPSSGFDRSLSSLYGESFDDGVHLVVS